MMYDSHMKRTTIFLSEELERQLVETARRTHQPRAELVRRALEIYLANEVRPRPTSLGLGRSPDASVTSENAKRWVRRRWTKR